LVDFVVSVLDTQVARQQLSGKQTMNSYSSFAKPHQELIASPSTELLALKMLFRLSELDIFGSFARRIDTSLNHNPLMPMLCKHLDSESNEITRQAYCSMGYLLRHSSNLDLIIFSYFDIIVKYINTLARLSKDDGHHLITIHHKLLSYLQKQVTSAGARKKFNNLQDELNGMTFVELCALLECDDSTAEVEAELKTFLAKRTSIPIEDQIMRCVEFMATELRCDVHDIMTIDQVIAAAVQLPLTMDELETCGFMDDDDDEFGSHCRVVNGKHMLKLIEDYHYAKNWQEYHHCGMFVMLYHCALQIPINDD